VVFVVASGCYGVCWQVSSALVVFNILFKFSADLVVFGVFLSILVVSNGFLVSLQQASGKCLCLVLLLFLVFPM
jgi:hypothetical protein